MYSIIPPIAWEPDDETSRHEVLANLHDRNIDMAKGFAKMVEKAEPSFKGTAERFRAMHARHADTLASLLAELGVQGNPDGTFMGNLHQAVVTQCAFFDDIDQGVMDQVRSGETSLLLSYDKAINDEAVQHLAATLREMRAEVEAELAATAHLE